MARTKKDANTADSTTGLETDLLRHFDDAGFGPLRWMGTFCTDALIDMNSDMASFAVDRLRENARAQHDFLHCRSLQDLQQAQLTYMSTAYSQYAAQMGKMIQRSLSLYPGGESRTRCTPV